MGMTSYEWSTWCGLEHGLNARRPLSGRSTLIVPHGVHPTDFRAGQRLIGEG